MKKLAPRTARLAGAGAAAFVLALAAPAAAQAAEGDGPSCGTATGEGVSNVFLAADFCKADSDGDTLTVTDARVENLALGNATHDDSSVTVTGLPGLSGELRVTAVVEDQDGNEAEWNIVVELLDAPKVPTANGDSFSLEAGETETGNVKNNDGSGDAPATDWDVFLVSEPTKGELKLSADGSFTYEANSGASGADTFSYKLEKDGDSSNTATVSINIKAAGGGGGDDDDNNGGDNNNGDNNNGGNTGKDTNADKDKLAKTGMSLPTVAVTGAGALGAGAVALWFTRRRKESGSTI